MADKLVQLFFCFVFFSTDISIFELISVFLASLLRTLAIMHAIENTDPTRSFVFIFSVCKGKGELLFFSALVLLVSLVCFSFKG